MPALGFVCYRLLYLVEVLLGATRLILRVCWGLELFLVNNAEEVYFLYLYFFLSLE